MSAEKNIILQSDTCPALCVAYSPVQTHRPPAEKPPVGSTYFSQGSSADSEETEPFSGISCITSRDLIQD